MTTSNNQPIRNRIRNKAIITGAAGITLLLLSIILSLGIGSVSLPAGEITRILLHHLPWVGDSIPVTWEPQNVQIIMNVRLPRVLLALLVGGALGVAGAAFQGVLRNPLADPFTLGVSSGASVGAAVLIYFGMQYAIIGQFTLPVVAFISAVLTLLIVLRMASENGKIPIQTLILSGVVVQAFLGSIVSFLVAISKNTVNEILFWTMGSLVMRGEFVSVLFPYLMIGLLILIAYSRPLNMLALGERQASHMGLNVERTKWVVLLTATLVTAAAVSVAGVIGFVGLVVPHILRLIIGADYRLLIPMSAVGGAIYVLWADTIARTLLQTEIPLGVVTSFLGAPFFAFLLIRSKRKRQEG